jgi:two-component system, NarL family, sensor histidine kinase FusK
MHTLPRATIDAAPLTKRNTAAQHLPARPSSGKLRWLGILAGIALFYFLTGTLGLRLATVNPSVSPVWAPTGIALAALLIFGYEAWPAIFVAAFAVNVLTAGTVFSSLGIAAGNTLEALAGVYLVNRFAHGRKVFERAEDVFKFAVFAALGSTAISATVGLLSLKAAGFVNPGTFGPSWLTWWLGDAVGALVVAPCLVLWSRPLGHRTTRQMTEGLIAVLSVMVACMLLFGGPYDRGLEGYHLGFLWLPLVVWMAFRARPQVSATTVVVLGIFAIRGTLLGYGIFSEPDMNRSLLVLQAFMGVVAMTNLVVSAVVLERNRNLAALKKAKDNLEVEVASRTAELEIRIAEQELVRDSLRQLSARLRHLQDDERQKLSRELHDAVGQTLAAVLMNLAVLEKRAASLDAAGRKALTDCKEQAALATREIRTISYLLHPPLLHEAGLAPALEWFVAGFAQRSGIEVQLDLSPEIERLPEAVEISLFRVVQESLTNVHRHSDSRRALVRLTMDQSTLALEVKDEGSGSPAVAEGLGIIGMRERLIELGGSFQFISSEGGTTVRATLPLSAFSSRAAAAIR